MLYSLLTGIRARSKSPAPIAQVGGSLDQAQRLFPAFLLFLLRAAGFSDEGKDFLEQVHDQAQDPQRQKGSSHADYHHGESEGPFGIVHGVLSESGRSEGRARLYFERGRASMSCRDWRHEALASGRRAEDTCASKWPRIGPKSRGRYFCNQRSMEEGSMHTLLRFLGIRGFAVFGSLARTQGLPGKSVALTK